MMCIADGDYETCFKITYFRFYMIREMMSIYTIKKGPADLQGLFLNIQPSGAGTPGIPIDLLWLPEVRA